MALERVTLDLDPVLKRRVERIARRQNRSVPEWITETLRRELEAQDADPFSRVSVPSFARDWESEDDAIYDEPTR